jgi:hypothetical protein
LIEFDSLEWDTDSSIPMHYKSCNKCKAIIYRTAHVYKSDIYENYTSIANPHAEKWRSPFFGFAHPPPFGGGETIKYSEGGHGGK